MGVWEKEKKKGRGGREGGGIETPRQRGREP